MRQLKVKRSKERLCLIIRFIRKKEREEDKNAKLPKKKK